MLVTSEFRPKNIVISDFGAKNVQIAECRIKTVSEFDGERLFHFVFTV